MADKEYEQPEWGKKLSKCNLIPQRYIHAIFGMLAIFNAYTMRSCLSIAIVKLVKPREYTEEDLDKEKVCPPDPDINKEVERTGEHDWSQFTQGFILSSFYIGYLISHIPGGILADKYGSKWVLSLGILSTAIFTALTPICIDLGGSTALIVLRILMGIGEGTTFPALSVLMADWVPVEERGLLGSLVMGGGQLGTIVGNVISGWLLDYFAWPWTFYVWAVVALLWFILYIIFCYNNPNRHPFISQKEKDFLNEKISNLADRRRELPPTPIVAILTSVPVWALVSAQIGHDWAFYVMSTDLPKYFHDVLQINTRSNGLYSSLPFVAMWICSLLSGIIADVIIRRQWMNTTQVRKMMTAIAAFGPAIFLVGASYSGCDRLAVIINFVLCMALMGAYYAGMKLTPLDLSPNYTGILMAITNGIGSLTGVIAPATVGLLTPNTTINEWRLVFWLAFAILSITAIVYCIWASGEVQPWNNPEPKESKDKEKK